MVILSPVRSPAFFPKPLGSYGCSAKGQRHGLKMLATDRKGFEIDPKSKVYVGLSQSKRMIKTNYNNN